MQRERRTRHGIDSAWGWMDRWMTIDGSRKPQMHARLTSVDLGWSRTAVAATLLFETRVNRRYLSLA